MPVRTVELKGLSLGFAAFTEWRNAPAADFAGRVTMLGDLVANDCALLRYSETDHLCIVAHWDREFRHVPRRATRALAQEFAGSGAELIVGHHAHVLQPAERIGDSLVAYGLGDFLGTALPSVPWPLQLGGILVADISADAGDEGAGRGLCDGAVRARARGPARAAGAARCGRRRARATLEAAICATIPGG